MFARISIVVLAGFLLVALGGMFQTTAAQTEENKTIVQRVADEVWSQGNLAAADEIFAADFVNYDPNPGGVTDLEGYKGWVLEWRAAFPDYQVEVHDLIAEVDKVGARCTVTGTHQGDFFGVPATGSQVTITMINIHRLADGKIVEAWWSYDLLGVMQQIGYYPPMPDAPLPILNRKPEDYPWGPSSDVTGDAGDPETNKDLVLRGELEGWGQGNAAVAVEPMAPTFVNHDPMWPSVTDYESYKQWVEGMNDPEDPLNITDLELVAEGDKVVERATIDLGGGITLSAMIIWRFADGKIVEAWWSKDMLAPLIGWGLVPPLPEHGTTAVESRSWGQVKSLFK